MLLAAGRGNRMRPLTDATPKPLLQVHGRPLLEWPMRALAAQGVERVLVNTGWLGEQIPARFGAMYAHDGGLPATQLDYSEEEIDFGYALETAGGIARALPRLEEGFWLAAGDVYAPDFVFDAEARARFLASGALAHLWLVPNPAHNPGGDFALAADGLLHATAADDTALPRYTYSTIGLFRHALFAEPWCSIPHGNPQGTAAPLAPLLRAAMAQGLVTGSLYTGRWTDVGTPERLAELNATPL
ncbi:MAG: hypothetical protein RL244_1156 [Pseudomonadota bacterium]|jgi:MurNAc alpha-1-phosphate uridylyltransferase